jgi:SAM-dependent methyltransferase
MTTPNRHQAVHIVGGKLEVDNEGPDDCHSGERLGDLISNGSSDDMDGYRRGYFDELANETDTPVKLKARGIIKDSRQFRKYLGRRYHAFADRQYWLPNDDIEISRLDVQHHIWRLTLGGGLHISPVPQNAKHVLDVGTGPGTWAIDFAEAYPDTQVLGTDLSPIQPTEGVPKNLTFMMHNAEEEWDFPNKFDFVHARMIVMGIHDWPKFFANAWHALEPGGWLEVSNAVWPVRVHEDGDSIPEHSSYLYKWSALTKAAALNDGIDIDLSRRYGPMLEAQGFVNVRVEQIQWPCSPWAKGEVEKLLGMWMVPNMRGFIRPSAQALLTKRLGWSDEQVDELVRLAEPESENPANRFYIQLQASRLFLNPC